MRHEQQAAYKSCILSLLTQEEKIVESSLQIMISQIMEQCTVYEIWGQVCQITSENLKEENQLITSSIGALHLLLPENMAITAMLRLSPFYKMRSDQPPVT